MLVARRNDGVGGASERVAPEGGEEEMDPPRAVDVVLLPGKTRLFNFFVVFVP